MQIVEYFLFVNLEWYKEIIVRYSSYISVFLTTKIFFIRFGVITDFNKIVEFQHIKQKCFTNSKTRIISQVCIAVS